MNASMKRAFDAVEAHVKDWAPDYAHHTHLVREGGGVAVFNTVWSKPTKEKPIAESLAVVEVTVDLTGEVPAVQHRMDGGHAAFTRQLAAQQAQIDAHVSDKLAVRGSLAALDGGALPRPAPYDPAAPTLGTVAAAEAPPPPGAPASGILSETDEELERMLVKLFNDADADHNGVLDVHEFFTLFQTADLGLSRRDVAFILAEADVSGDNVVQYAEFVPIAVDVIQSLRLRAQLAKEVAASEESATDEAVTTLYGMERGELEAMMQAVFKQADENGDGVLSRHEFSECLNRVQLGPTRLTKKEIRYFQNVVEVDDAGRVSYEAFVPVVWDLLVETLKSNYLAASQGDLYDHLRELCAAEDVQTNLAEDAGEDEEPAASGKLRRDALKRVLHTTPRVQLTPVQVYTVLAEAEEDEDGNIEYGAFLLRAVPLIESMVSPVLAAQRAKAADRAKHTPVEVLGGRDRAGVERKLRKALEAVDAGGKGTVSAVSLERALKAPDLELTPQQVHALVAHSDADHGADVAIEPFAKSAYDVLHALSREQALQKEMADELQGPRKRQLQMMPRRSSTGARRGSSGSIGTGRMGSSGRLQGIPNAE